MELKRFEGDAMMKINGEAMIDDEDDIIAEIRNFRSLAAVSDKKNPEVLTGESE